MKLKILTLFIIVITMLTACHNQEPQQWEYMVLPIEGSKLPTVYAPNDKEMLTQQSDFKSLEFNNQNFNMMLNSYGKDGWELVNIYSTIETVFPNFGNEEYHSGIKENTRTQTINFVFKRKINSGAPTNQ